MFLIHCKSFQICIIYGIEHFFIRDIRFYCHRLGYFIPQKNAIKHFVFYFLDISRIRRFFEPYIAKQSSIYIRFRNILLQPYICMISQKFFCILAGIFARLGVFVSSGWTDSGVFTPIRCTLSSVFPSFFTIKVPPSTTRKSFFIS